MQAMLSKITKGTSIEGTFNVEGDVHIEGLVKGDLRAGGTVIMTESAVLEGTVTAVSADIAGKVDGDCRISERLTLRGTAIFEGGLKASRITIEDGADLNGDLDVGSPVTI